MSQLLFDVIMLNNIDNQGEMERSLIHGFQRLLQLLLLSALLLTFVLLPQTRSQHITEDEQHCGVERVAVEINIDGCEPTITTIRACNGACLSAVTTVLKPPFSVEHCTLCQPTLYKHNKPKSIKLVCDGKVVHKRMYFPRIEECGCVNRTSASSIE